MRRWQFIKLLGSAARAQLAMSVIGYPKVVRHFALGLACLSLAGVGGASAQAQDGVFQFGLIGDMPYTTVQQREYQRVLTL